MLHFHLSSDRMALAGARKANALAWNRGSLSKGKTLLRNDVMNLYKHIHAQWGVLNLSSRQGDYLCRTTGVPAL